MSGENSLDCRFDIGGLAHIEHQRLGFPASFGFDSRYHRLQRILAPAGYDHSPAICRQRLGAGLPDTAAAARHPRHALLVVCHFHPPLLPCAARLCY